MMVNMSYLIFDSACLVVQPPTHQKKSLIATCAALALLLAAPSGTTEVNCLGGDFVAQIIGSLLCVVISFWLAFSGKRLETHQQISTNGKLPRNWCFQ